MENWTDRPIKGCWNCKSDRWYPTPDGRWLLEILESPQATGPAIDKSLELKARVIKGNEKLWQAWLQIREIAHDSEKWRAQMDLWVEAGNKLKLLCLELQGSYKDCLYMVNGQRTKTCLSEPDGWFCQACPSEIPYWAQELVNLPGPWHPKTTPEFDKDQAKFIETLGGKE